MCGIAGFELAHEDGAARGRTLNACLANRGPDGDWYAEHGGYGLAQTRLAVIDLSDRVAYPIGNEDGTLWLLFNGEIYDHRLLRAELERAGHHFRTDCDAEVALHAYEQWDLDGLARLNGMYALAIVDERRGELVLARDPLGIKPLVRTTSDRFAFASDATALVSAGFSSGAIDTDAIEEYAAFHYVPHPRTGILGISQVQPGTALRRRADGSEQTLRFAPRPLEGVPSREPVALETLDAVLQRSVARQLVADVNVGVLLSGGVDSSLLLAYAAALGAQPSAFTIGFAAHGDFDESARAAAFARAVGVDHHVRGFEVGFADAVEAMTQAYDTPFGDASALATLQLARLAREHVTVVLSGTGGDDLYAGYYRHRAHRLRRALRLVPAALLERLARTGYERGAERSSALTLARSYVNRIAGAGVGDDLEQYLGLVGNRTSLAGRHALGMDMSTSVTRERVAERLQLSRDGDGSRLRQLQRFELDTYLAGDLLVKEDRATMAFGLEGRVPMLDAEMVALASRVPDDQKATLLGGKRLLRELARSRLPDFPSRGRKRGFAVPLRDLFAGPWRSESIAWINELDSTLVDGRAASRLVTRSPSVASDLWAVVALAAWERRLRAARVSALT
jgi:asparagine synthase (glutamine-hydrolysing)